jgi:hypothetical protein
MMGFWVFRSKVYKHVRKHQVKYSLFKTEKQLNKSNTSYIDHVKILLN